MSSTTTRSGRKPPGVKAKRKGTKLKRGAAVQVVIYPRPHTKAVLVDASRREDEALSSFVIKAALARSAIVLGKKVADLVPDSELSRYV